MQGDITILHMIGTLHGIICPSDVTQLETEKCSDTFKSNEGCNETPATRED